MTKPDVFLIRNVINTPKTVREDLNSALLTWLNADNKDQRRDAAKDFMLLVMKDGLWTLVEDDEAYKRLFNIKFPSDMGEIEKAIIIRHDLVHRNGKDKDGKQHNIQKSSWG